MSKEKQELVRLNEVRSLTFHSLVTATKLFLDFDKRVEKMEIVTVNEVRSLTFSGAVSR